MDKAFYIHIKKRFIRIAWDDIYYIEAIGHHVRIHTCHGTYLPHLSLKRLATALPSDQFARVNRSAMVNLLRIKWFDSENVTLLAAKETVLSFSDRFRKQLEQQVTIILHEDTSPSKQKVSA